MNNDLKSSDYILFLNSLDLKVNIIDIVEIREHSECCLSGWTGIKSIVCKSDKKNVYEVDIRFAWNSKVFKQHLYDYGWNQSILLHSNERNLSRFKLIIYLCHPLTNLVNSIWKEVPDEFVIGNYWKSIYHFYLLLPLQHPFELPELMNEPINYLCTDSSLSLLSVTKDENNTRQGGLRTKGINKSGTLRRPLISVITIVFNGEEKLEQTIQSVINQNYDNFEYIIIDGGSTDKTVKIIKEYESLIDYWISEEDRGIYDAMNKGINLANGQWLNFMNCGDIFYNYQSLNSINLDPEVDFYYSDVIHSDSKQNIYLAIASYEKKDFNHQSMVYQKKAHEGYEYLVHDNLTISDYFFFRKNDNKNWYKLDMPLAIYNTEGISANISTHFVQKLFVNFISGDISELEMVVLIIERKIKEAVKNMIQSVVKTLK